MRSKETGCLSELSCIKKKEWSPESNIENDRPIVKKIRSKNPTVTLLQIRDELPEYGRNRPIQAYKDNTETTEAYGYRSV